MGFMCRESAMPEHQTETLRPTNAHFGHYLTNVLCEKLGTV